MGSLSLDEINAAITSNRTEKFCFFDDEKGKRAFYDPDLEELSIEINGINVFGV
jgi:hypothetical protein